MKKTAVLLTLILAAGCASAQVTESEPPVCDCPDCREKAAAGETGFTLPGLEGLNAGGRMSEPESAGHDHAEHDVDEENHESHADDDHVDEAVPHDDHAGHDHADHGLEAAVQIDESMENTVGIQVYEAEGGTISRVSVFPAEIKLNRDRTAAVSPRYASVVRQVFAEIGDDVHKGDVLASLENRETLAVYTVAAPLDGVVISKDLAVGETADADKVLYEIADLSSVWADISIFPQYQHLINKGMAVEFVAHDGHTAAGTVKYISPIVSHETRTFTARCVLEGFGADFTPGAFVRARITTETAKVDVRVERSAVQQIDGEAVVFVPGEHGYDAATVVTGLADEYFVEIRQGLHPGDRYVGAGAFTLKAEMMTSGMDPHAGHNH